MMVTLIRGVCYRLDHLQVHKNRVRENGGAHCRPPMPIILNISAMFGMPPPSPGRPPSPPKPLPICAIIPDMICQKRASMSTKDWKHTLHFLHVQLVSTLSLHHGLHHLLHTTTAAHLTLQLLQHTRWHRALMRRGNNKKPNNQLK